MKITQSESAKFTGMFLLAIGRASEVETGIVPLTFVSTGGWSFLGLVEGREPLRSMALREGRK